MKVKLNADALRMTVLKQIVNNASIGMRIDASRNIIDWIFPYTPNNLRLKRLRVRGDKLQQFETSLRINKSEFIEIDYHDVDFIYEGFK